MFIGRTDAEAEVPILWPPDAKNWLIGKDPDSGKDWRQEEKGMTKDKMVGWHHWLNGHEFEQAPGVVDGQGSLACCSPWGRRVGHDWTTELNWELKVGACGFLSKEYIGRYSKYILECIVVMVADLCKYIDILQALWIVSVTWAFVWCVNHINKSVKKLVMKL